MLLYFFVWIHGFSSRSSTIFSFAPDRSICIISMVVWRAHSISVTIRYWGRRVTHRSMKSDTPHAKTSSSDSVSHRRSTKYSGKSTSTISAPRHSSSASGRSKCSIMDTSSSSMASISVWLRCDTRSSTLHSTHSQTISDITLIRRAIESWIIFIGRSVGCEAMISIAQ